MRKTKNQRRKPRKQVWLTETCLDCKGIVERAGNQGTCTRCGDRYWWGPDGEIERIESPIASFGRF